MADFLGWYILSVPGPSLLVPVVHILCVGLLLWDYCCLGTGGGGGGMYPVSDMGLMSLIYSSITKLGDREIEKRERRGMENGGGGRRE